MRLRRPSENESIMLAALAIIALAMSLSFHGCTTVQPIKEVEKTVVIRQNVAYQLSGYKSDDELMMTIDTIWVEEKSRNSYKYLVPVLDTLYYSSKYELFFRIKR